MDRGCPFCGARFVETGIGVQHPYDRDLERACYFNGTHIGRERLEAWDRGMARLQLMGVEAKPVLPFL